MPGRVKKSVTSSSSSSSSASNSSPPSIDRSSSRKKKTKANERANSMKPFIDESINPTKSTSNGTGTGSGSPKIPPSSPIPNIAAANQLYLSPLLTSPPQKSSHNTRPSKSVVSKPEIPTQSTRCSGLFSFLKFIFILTFFLAAAFLFTQPADRWAEIKSNPALIPHELARIFSFVSLAIKEKLNSNQTPNTDSLSHQSVQNRIPSAIESLSLPEFDSNRLFASIHNHFASPADSSHPPLVLHFAVNSHRKLPVTFDSLPNIPQIHRLNSIVRSLTTGLFGANNSNRFLPLSADMSAAEIRKAIENHFSSSSFGIVSFSLIPPRQLFSRSLVSEVQLLTDEIDSPHPNAIFIFVTDVPMLDESTVSPFDSSSIEKFSRHVYRDLWNRTDLAESNPLELIEPLLARIIRNTIWIKE